METGLIYKITNKLNNKIYIGQTITSLNERWSGHKCDSKRKNTPLYSSMKKHFDKIDEVFEIEVIEKDIPYDKLDDIEVYWIKTLNSLHPNGYNLSLGGQSFKTKEERLLMSERIKGDKNPMYGRYGELNPFFGRNHTEETKRKISESRKNITISEETKQKIAVSTAIRHQEKGHPFLGKNHTEEAKNKISKAMIGRYVSDETKLKMSENHARKQSVIMKDKLTDEYIMTFDSMKLASDWLRQNTKYTKAKSGEISSVCRGTKKTAYGFKWEYLKGVETIPMRE